MIFDVAPSFDQIFARNQFLNIRNVFIGKVRCQKVHDGRTGIGGVAEIDHLLPCLHQRAEAVRVNFGDVPVIVQNRRASLLSRAS